MILFGFKGPNKHNRNLNIIEYTVQRIRNIDLLYRQIVTDVYDQARSIGNNSDCAYLVRVKIKIKPEYCKY